MARKDDITGEGPVTGNSVSDSNQKTNRRFKRNLHEKRFYIPSQDRHVKLKVSSKTLKTINKKGIQAVLQEARKQGYDVEAQTEGPLSSSAAVALLSKR